MKLQYLGHSAFKINTDRGLSILIDPYLDNNPLATIKSKGLKADYIVLTHAHGDHLGDALTIADMTKTTLICVSELANLIAKRSYKVHAMQIGGGFNFEFGYLKLVQALHGSVTPDGHYGGLAAGVILQIEDKTLYHCGDTGLFGDMKLIGERHNIDVLMVPIGGNYTMDIGDAVYAVDLIQPKLSIPMHYNTFAVIKADPEQFTGLLAEKGYAGKVMQIGEELVL